MFAVPQFLFNFLVLEIKKEKVTGRSDAVKHILCAWK